MIVKLLGLALAGAAGTLARYGLAGLVQNSTKGSFPWGTLVVNLIGCMLFGFAWTALTERLAVSLEMRTIILVGFMGAFTTFSSFVFDTSRLMGDSQWLAVLGNVTAHNLTGILAFFAGLLVARLVF